MEETMRSMLQFKARAEQLKQEKTSLTVAYETRIHQFQNTITKLGNENEALKKQIRALEAAGAGEVQNTLLERLRLAETDNCNLTKDAELQRRQYERCLDDVANQVVRALLSQKGLREEINVLQRRIKELETQNCTLTSVLVQQLQQHTSCHASPCEDAAKLHSAVVARSPSCSGEDSGKPTVNLVLPSLSTATTPSDAATPERLRRHHVLGKLWTELQEEPADASLLAAFTQLDPVLWLPMQRPRSLNLQLSASPADVAAALNVTAACCQHRRAVKPLTVHTCRKPVEDEGSESPESGNRDEGYSTMSSDVQGEAARCGDSGAVLEDLKEETDTAVAALSRSPSLVVVEDASDPDILYIALGLGNPRHSFPPTRDLLPYQHVMRSFSDSHLCLKLEQPSPASSVLDLLQPLRRSHATPSLLDDDSSSCSEAVVEGCWWDADYVQHWLRLDDSRSALQQQHRHMLELEQGQQRQPLELGYDQSELEDWSMTLSSEDIAESPLWRRMEHQATSSDSTVESPLWRRPEDSVLWRRMEQLTPGQLPSIQEHNTLELEEDANECLWNNASYLVDRSGGELMSLLLDGSEGGWPYSLASPGGSWSSNSEDLGHDGSSKRSSAAMSGFSDDAESPAIGTDFTRDFYRLVKFESTKSLASTSSRNLSDTGSSLSRTQDHDREQALQSVLHFIAEQQQYCASREQRDTEPFMAEHYGGSREHHHTDLQDAEQQDSMQHEAEHFMVDGTHETKDLVPSGSGQEDCEPTFDQGDDIEPCCDKQEPQIHTIIEMETIEDLYPTMQENELQNSSNRKGICSELLLNEHNASITNINNKVIISKLKPEQCINLSLEILKPVYTETFVGGEEDNCVTNLEESCHLKSDSVELQASLINCPPLDPIPRISLDLPKCVSGPSTMEVLVTVMEEDEQASSLEVMTESFTSTVSSPETVLRAGDSSPMIVVDSRVASFHERATSKDVIDELNRMIRKGEDGPVAGAACEEAGATRLDLACCCPTGWVHVERDIDFTDPKARANLLDVMLASSGSSSGSSSDSGDEPVDYQHLHRLHRFRRQKKASATREPLGVLRCPSATPRPSILGRDDFFVRYGDKEREAVASFDFLEDISTTSLSCTSSDTPDQPREMLDAATPSSEDSDDRTGGQISLSDSCAASFSGSATSLDNPDPSESLPKKEPLPNMEPLSHQEPLP